MQKLLGLVLLGIGSSVACLAIGFAGPEIDPSSAGSALALFAGALLVIRSRRAK